MVCQTSPVKSYGEACGISRALDAIGDRWALLVVRELMHGPKRFTDLRAGLPGAGPDMLAQRLKDLEAAGVLERATLPAPAASRVYALTEDGRALDEVLQALGRWGSRRPMPAGAAPLSPDSLGVALEATFRGGADVAVRLDLGGDALTARVRDGVLAVGRDADAVEATIAADTATLAALLWHGGALDDAEVSGSRRAAARFLKLFAI